jgi:hypothetical protein
MSNDPRIIELLSEMLVENRAMRVEQQAMRVEQQETNRRLTNLEHQQEIANIKQEAMIDEFVRLRTAIIKVAEGSSVGFDKLDDHERRIKALESRP